VKTGKTTIKTNKLFLYPKKSKKPGLKNKKNEGFYKAIFSYNNLLNIP